MTNLPPPPLSKCPTGIQGLDKVTHGGLPRGRTTLVCGGTGSGKTLLAVEFLVRGATEHDEPGVFLAFEETAAALATNCASLGFDLPRLEREGRLAMSAFDVKPGETLQAGEFNLDGLFLRVEHAIDRVGARRVVFDTVEVLFQLLPDPERIRQEVYRLFRWLADRGVTALVTAERGEGALTRHGLEEYVSDCVLLLDNRVQGQINTRRLRVVKYRGSAHDPDEVPFMIGGQGLVVLPLSTIGLDYEVSSERVSSGVAGLDALLGGLGYYRGSSVLVNGGPGTGKSSLGAQFLDAACRREERCLLVSFEEAPRQILRNMRSIGIDLDPWFQAGLLRCLSVRPSQQGLEQHLVRLVHAIEQHEPRVVVIDPISNLDLAGESAQVCSMLTRLIDAMKARGVTGLCTMLESPGLVDYGSLGHGVSSLMDTVLSLEVEEDDPERQRYLHVVKSRGMSHVRRRQAYSITDAGITLGDEPEGP